MVETDCQLGFFGANDFYFGGNTLGPSKNAWGNEDLDHD